MKRHALYLTALLLCGCAARGKSPAASQVAALPEYEPASASALAFDSPVSPDYPLVGLARAPRELQAFAGFESVTEYFAVSVDDRQSTDRWNNGYDRESVSLKVGVRTR